MVMEFASGGELFEHILAHRYLKEREACRFFAQLIAGVSYIHNKGIVHRDLKLENLLLDANRNIIITDFGFANMTRGEEGFLLQTSCGSPCYAAPELVISDGYVGEAADIWSCGVILYAMLCGYLPFDDDPNNPDGDNINLLYKYILETELDFPDYVSDDARLLLQRMLVPDPKYRAKMPEVMAHRWLSPAAYIFEAEKAAMKKQKTSIPPAITPAPAVTVTPTPQPAQVVPSVPATPAAAAADHEVPSSMDVTTTSASASTSTSSGTTAMDVDENTAYDSLASKESNDVVMATQPVPAQAAAAVAASAAAVAVAAAAEPPAPAAVPTAASSADDADAIVPAVEDAMDMDAPPPPPPLPTEDATAAPAAEAAAPAATTVKQMQLRPSNDELPPPPPQLPSQSSAAGASTTPPPVPPALDAGAAAVQQQQQQQQQQGAPGTPSVLSPTFTQVVMDFAAASAPDLSLNKLGHSKSASGALLAANGSGGASSSSSITFTLGANGSGAPSRTVSTSVVNVSGSGGSPTSTPGSPSLPGGHGYPVPAAGATGSGAAVQSLSSSMMSTSSTPSRRSRANSSGSRPASRNSRRSYAVEEGEDANAGADGKKGLMNWFRKKSSMSESPFPFLILCTQSADVVMSVAESNEDLQKTSPVNPNGPAIHFHPQQAMTPSVSAQGTMVSPSSESRRSVALTSDERMVQLQKRYDIGTDVEQWGILPPPRMRRSATTAKRPVSSYARSVHEPSGANGAGSVQPGQDDAPPRPSMQTNRSKFTYTSMLQSVDVVPPVPGSAGAAPEYPLSVSAFASIAKNPKFTYHSGPIDQRALTSREPTEVVSEIVKVLLERGMEVRSTGVETGEFKIKVVRPQMFIHNGQVITGEAAAAAAAAYDTSRASSTELLQKQLAAAVAEEERQDDGYDLTRFSVDTHRTGPRPSMALDGKAAGATSPPPPNSLKERKRRAKGATKLALVIASLPVSLVKRVRYLAKHGPAWAHGWDGRTKVDDLENDPIQQQEEEALALALQQHSQGQRKGSHAGDQSSEEDGELSEHQPAGSAGSSTVSLQAPAPPRATSSLSVHSATRAGRPSMYANRPTYLPEIRFNIEVQKIRNLRGLFVVDFRRIRGDIWAFKRLYNQLIVEFPLGSEKTPSIAASSSTAAASGPTVVVGEV
ncbi:hypothetical protein HDU96_007498 [Phlyctochytrium bullatum]|nr:hypothetical protein HDU96_007498 [Phlyctochytrium bullatum]